MTISGMAEYTVRLKDCDYVTRSISLAKEQALRQAREAGSCRMEAHYPDGGGYIINYKLEDGEVGPHYLPRDWED